jgi:hypothetical protein
MIFRIYYLLTAIETFLLSIYMASVGSTEQASFLFGLSISRLFLVALAFLIGLFFLICAFRPFFQKGSRNDFEHRFLRSEIKVWLSFLGGLVLAGIGLFLLTRQINAFGNFKLIYQRLEPALVWLVMVGAQTAAFSAIWYCARFIRGNADQDDEDLQKELLPLFALFAILLVVKLVFVTSTAYGPLGRGDEMTYYDMADSFYRGFFSPKDTHHYPPLYPLTLVITLVFKAWTFEGIKLLNVIFSSSLVFPVYFIARSHVDARKALLAAFLACLIPYHLVFPRRILSENLFFPLFLWTMLVTYVKPENEKYRLPWDLVNGGLVAALYLTRYITLATIPFFILSWWVKPFPGESSLFKPGSKKLLHLAAFCAALLMVFSPWLIDGLGEGVPLKLLLGFGVTSRTTQAQLTFPRLLVWVVLYACYFILVAAPVLSLLIISLWQIDIKNWRQGFGRWIFQTLALMAGFYAAVTRHSWRAYYNADIPSAIMGRYLIVFSVIYFIIAVVAADNFQKNKFKSRWAFVFFSQLLPIGLVTFAYFTLINGAIFSTDGDLLKSLGSVDAFFTEILGPLFFLLLFLVYAVTNWFFYYERRETALTVLAVGLVLYYSVGIPSYYRELMDYQTYPYLAKQISRMLPPPDPKSGQADRVSVFLPEDRTNKSGAEIYNGLRTHGFTRTIVEGYSEDAVDQMTTDIGFIIISLPDDLQQTNLPIFKINDEQFQIIPINK